MNFDLLFYEKKNDNDQLDEYDDNVDINYDLIKQEEKLIVPKPPNLIEFMLKMKQM